MVRRLRRRKNHPAIMVNTTDNRSAPSRMKLAELASGVGALVVGIGIGALFATVFRSTAVAITLTGLALHSFGMWDKHRLETRVDSPAWVQVAYWICWVMLAILSIAIMLR